MFSDAAKSFWMDAVQFNNNNNEFNLNEAFTG